ncbi:MAG: lipase [Methylophaga sp.]|nr:MAG: lipase [Methylophaga sp.]
MAEKQQLKQNLQDTNQWMRILYMVLFWIVLYFVLMVTGLIIFIQVLFALITGSDNENLRKFAADLTKYINQIILFLTYNDDRKPFPFAAWGKVDKVKPVVKSTPSNEVDEHEAVIEIEPESKSKSDDPEK